jgi:hypothetical protein
MLEKAVSSDASMLVRNIDKAPYSLDKPTRCAAYGLNVISLDYDGGNLYARRALDDPHSARDHHQSARGTPRCQAVPVNVTTSS